MQELHYAVLDIDPETNPTPKFITRQYRAMSLKAHPDKGGSDELQAKVNKAYEVLKDAKKRARYDRLGVDWQAEGAVGADGDGDEEKKQELFDRAIDGIEPLKLVLHRSIWGGAYIFFIQYFWTSLLLSVVALVPVALPKLLDDEEKKTSRLDVGKFIAVLLAVTWSSRMFGWLFFIVEAAVLWFILFSDFENRKVQAGLALTSAFLAWWFSGRVFYYIVLVILLLASYALLGMFLSSVFFAVETQRVEAIETSLERFASEVRPEVRRLRKEIAVLRAKNQELETKCAAQGTSAGENEKKRPGC